MSHESNLPAKPSVKVRGWVDPFHPQATAFGCVMAGTTVADAISKACKVARTRKRYMRRGLVYLGRKTAQGDYKWTRIPQSAWNKVRLKPNDSLTFRLLPEGGGGGKNPLRAILNIVVMTVAVVAAVFTAGASLFAAGGMLAGATLTAGGLTVGGLIAGALVGGLVMTMGQYLIDAIAPIKNDMGSIASADDKDVYSIAGSSNTIDKWGQVPMLFGKGRIAPKKAAAPYSELKDDDMYLHELFIWGECGTGDIKISDIRLGDTPIDDYSEVDYKTWRYDPADPWYSDLYPTGVVQEDLNIKITKAGGEYTRTASKGASSISLDFTFPTLVRFKDNGSAEYQEVTYSIEYKKTDSNWWTTLGQNTTNGATFTLDHSSATIYIDTATNTLKYVKYGKVPDGGIALYTINRETYEKENSTHVLSGFNITVERGSKRYQYYDSWEETYYYYYGIERITISSGVWAWNKGSLTIGAKSTSAVRRTFYIGGLDKNAQYEVRVKRITDDHDTESKDDQKVQDEGYWSAIRSHTNDRPFDVKYPCVFTAVRVKATDQLNGAIQNLTGLYQAIYKTPKLEEVNGEVKFTGEWVNEETRDLIPAIRHVLQENHARPQSNTVIDWDNLIETHIYWRSMGWTFDKILDSQTSIFNFIQNVCATGLASPTFIDGKWAVIIDKPRTEVVMGINSANSWGWTVDRTTIELPHIIQCDFVNEDTWEADTYEIEVDDSYKVEGRSPIIEKVTFDGVTKSKNIYKQARFHYADAKMQVRTISMTMWDESLVATRGDLVSLSQPYLIPKDLEAGRIKAVYKDGNGYVTRITTDVLNTIGNNPGDRNNFGIRIYLSDGTTAHARLRVSNNGVENTRTLVFADTVTANIEKGNKYVLGYYEEKETLAIIKSMKFNADFTCQLTCIDYIEDKYKVFDPNFVIPEFVSTISKPLYASRTLNPAPVVSRIVTDEGAIIRVGKTLKSRALIYFSIPSKLDNRAEFIRCAYRVHDTVKDFSVGVVPGKWVIFDSIPVSETVVFCNDVEDGEVYDFRFQYISSIGYTSNWTQVDNVKIIGKTSLPPTPESVSLEPFGASGMRTFWPASPVIDLDHYKVVLSGNGFSGWTGVTQDLEFITPIWKWTGRLKADLYLVDVLGLVSETPASTTYDILIPATPVPVSSTLNNTFTLSWQNCKTTWPIKYYKVEDAYLSIEEGRNFNVADEWTSIEARPADAFYRFSVTPVDVFDNNGATATVDIYIRGISAFTSMAVVEGDTIKLTWGREYAPFDIDYYEIFAVDDNDDSQLTSIAHIKGNTYSVPVSGTGTKNFQIQAVDIAGNRSPISECNASIEEPYAPTGFSVKIVNDHIELIWEDPYKTKPSSTRLPILSYDVIRQWDFIRDDGMVETREEDYGTYDALNLSVSAVSTGLHTFMVRARDTGGNTGDWATVDLQVFNPKRVFFYNCGAVDNNVMLYWQAPQITSFPISSYILYDIDEDGMIVERGRTDSLFSAQIESVAGQYTYAVRAVDVAGNIGDMSMISILVSQPPDFIMYHDYDSIFNGERENIVLSGEGYMFGPVVENETWEENISRVAALTGISPNAVTWQDKCDNGYNYFMSPFINETAIYTETVDVGVEVPSTKITITPTKLVMEGNPELRCKIEISSDGDFWREMADNSFAVYATSFRYVRVTLTWTGGMLRIDNINFKLDVKRISDAGRAHAGKDDNGEGWISMQETPMLTGTWIPFKTFFTDIESLPRPNVINDTEGYTAFTVFEDTIYPTGFRAFVLDKNGNRVSADVDWSAFGV